MASTLSDSSGGGAGVSEGSGAGLERLPVEKLQGLLWARRDVLVSIPFLCLRSAILVCA